MSKTKFVTTFAFLALFATILGVTSVSASTDLVEFNGVFQEGTTLYSDTIQINGGDIWGKDAYPDKTGLNERVKVCEIVNKTKKTRVCTTNEAGYVNKTKRVCSRAGYFEPIVCEDVVYQQKTKAKRICETVEIQVPKEVCHWERNNPAIIACRNPNGEYTNQLRLENFGVSFDAGSSWQPVPYYGGRLEVGTVDALFRVIVPSECSPTYKIDKAIYVRQ